MTYKVWVHFVGGAYYTVEADDVFDACERAIEIANPDDCTDWDCNADFASIN